MMIVKKLQYAVRRFRSLSSTAHKPYLIIVIELVAWTISNRGEINVYFDYELYLRGNKAADFVRTTLFNKIEKELNSPEYFPILEDKYFFHQVLEGHGFRSPKNLFLIDSSGILNMESRQYVSNEDFQQKDFEGFCKLINGFGGQMIFEVQVIGGKLRLNRKEISFSEFIKVLDGGRFLIQERIVQHEEMNNLNPSCINTLRLLTVRIGRTYHYYQGFLRIGINNSIVDNSAAGNYTIGMDKKTGKLMEYAFSAQSHSDLHSLDRHPQTQTVFKDFEIPYFEESIEMVKSLHLLFHQFFMIGWDIGITPEGPVVIEGNNITTLHPFQVLYGGMKSSFLELAERYRTKH